MARTALPPIVADRTGTVAVSALVASDNVNGNTIAGNDGRIAVEVKNTGAGSGTVTFLIPGTLDGVAATNGGLQVTVAAAGDVIVGPFPPAVYNQSDGSLSISTSASTMQLRAFHV